MTSGMFTPRPHPEMRSAQDFTLRPQNRDQSEVRLSWKSLFFNVHVQNTPSISHFDAILTSSQGTSKRHFPLRMLTLCWCFVLISSYIRKKPPVKTAGETSQDAYRWRRWEARGDMREEIHFKGADAESDFWLISILRSDRGHFVMFFVLCCFFLVNDNLDECQFLHSFHFHSFR